MFVLLSPSHFNDSLCHFSSASCLSIEPLLTHLKHYLFLQNKNVVIMNIYIHKFILSMNSLVTELDFFGLCLFLSGKFWQVISMVGFIHIGPYLCIFFFNIFKCVSTIMLFSKRNITTKIYLFIYKKIKKLVNNWRKEKNSGEQKINKSRNRPLHKSHVGPDFRIGLINPTSSIY